MSSRTNQRIQKTQKPRKKAAKRQPIAAADRKMRKLAAIEFEPWSDDRLLTDTEEVLRTQVAIPLRVAVRVMMKTKQELIESARETPLEFWTETEQVLGKAQAVLADISRIYDAVRARLLCARSVVALGDAA